MEAYNYIKKYLYLLIAVIYIALIIKYSNQILIALQQHYKAILYSTALFMLGISAQSINYIDLLNKNFKIKVLPTIRTWSISSLINYMAPFQPGLLVRATYFKSLGISYTESTSTVIKQLHYSVWIAVGVLSAALPTTTNLLLTTKILTAVLFLSWFFLLKPITHLLKQFIHNKYILLILKTLHFPKPRQFILCFLHYVIIASLFYIVLNEFGIPASFGQTLLLSTVLVLSALASVTPNNLGIQEVIIAALVFDLGVSNYEHITLPFVIRLSHIMACFMIILITLLLYKLSNKT